MTFGETLRQRRRRSSRSCRGHGLPNGFRAGKKIPATKINQSCEIWKRGWSTPRGPSKQKPADRSWLVGRQMPDSRTASTAAVVGMTDTQFNWESLVPHLIHPAKVAIIEAMKWIGVPVSPRELDR